MATTNPIPSTDTGDARDNRGRLDTYVNDTGNLTYTSRLGATLDTIAGKNAKADAAIATIQTNGASAVEQIPLYYGWRIVGEFASGFTYTRKNDIGKDGSGDYWLYNGALPFTVTAGTTPTAPTYTQVGLQTVNDLVFTNVAAAKAAAITIGQRVRTNGYSSANDGGHADYIVVAGGTGTDDGFSYHDMGNGNQLQLIIADKMNIRISGASSTNGLSGGTMDISANITTMINAGVSTVFIDNGTWLIENEVNITSGISIDGESDWLTQIYFGGSQGGFQVGFDTLGNNQSQVKFSNFNVRTTGTSTLANVFRITTAFQVYFERIRVFRMQRMCSDAIIDMDGLGAEIPVRVVIRDCYVDAAQYDTIDDGLNTPAFVWNRSGIQLIFDNTHVQSINRCAILGTAVSDPSYAGQFCEDTFFLNNSRFQIGTLGNIDQDGCGFECYEGANLVIDNSTIFLNNYGATQPPGNLNLNTAVKLKDTTGGSSALWSNVTVTNTRIFGNARTDRYYYIESGATFGLFTHDNNTYTQTKPDLPLIVSDGTGQVYEGENYNTNPNSYNGFVIIGNFTSGTPVGLDDAKSFIIRPTDGGSRILNQFSGGIVGVPYLIRFDPTGGSTVTLRIGSDATASGFLIGNGEISGRDFNMTDSDAIVVWRQNSDNISGGAYYVQLLKNVQDPVANSSDTASLNDIGNAINTTNKFRGKPVFNINTNRPVWATGSADSSIWTYSDGTTAHTPA